MKVSIITMHSPLNYGAVLQTYALQTYLEQCKAEVEIINYQPAYVVCDQKLTYVPRRYKGVLGFIYSLFYIIVKAPHKTYRKYIFKKFVTERLNVSKVLYNNYNQLVQNPPVSDRYICGSDQIWSLNNETYKDPAYFLGFINNAEACFSYAASGEIPYPLPQSMKDISVPYINRLKGISVRESISAKSLGQYINKPISVVCDPVFLHSAEEWKNMVYTKSLNSNYILVYNMGEIERVKEVAIKLSKLHRLKIFLITSSQRQCSWADKILVPTVDNFINYIINAEYVVTNSFHGTAFSIIFRKKFYVCSTNTANERIRSIINTLDINDALIENSDSELKVWDYNKKGINALKENINSSKNFIENIIKSNE